MALKAHGARDTHQVAPGVLKEMGWGQGLDPDWLQSYTSLTQFQPQISQSLARSLTEV